MIHRSFEQINKVDIETLLDNEVREIRTLEYKAELPGGADEDKREFLYDVSSLANASGGDLLFGVPAKDGIPIEPLGLRDLSADATILRLENIVRDGIDPRIPGIRMRALDNFPNGSVLIVRVPKSWAAPHMVTFKNVSRFYSRNSAGKYQLDVSEIRAAFAHSETIAEKIRRFRDDRLAKIIADETPVSLKPGSKIVLHVIPFSSFTPESSLSPTLMKQHHALLQAFAPGSYDTRFNIDGVVNLSGEIGNTGKRFYYCQAFRNGAIESVDSSLLAWNDERLIPDTAFGNDLITSVRSYLEFMQKLEVLPPFVVSCALLGVKGFRFPGRNRFPSDPVIAIERDVLILPDVVLEEFESEVSKALKPMLDGLWNAAGRERCTLYDAEGNLKQNP